MKIVVLTLHNEAAETPTIEVRLALEDDIYENRMGMMAAWSIMRNDLVRYKGHFWLVTKTEREELNDVEGTV